MTMKSDLISLLRVQWVSPLVALRECYCLSLSQRVGDLRREGYEIDDRWIDLRHSGKRVKEYRIIRGPAR